MSKIQKKLSIVFSPHEKASILAPMVAPALNGNDDEDLVCGNCFIVLASGVSEKTVASRFAAPFQLLVKCPSCGVYNNLPAKLSN
jgi:hypothetical protein